MFYRLKKVNISVLTLTKKLNKEADLTDMLININMNMNLIQTGHTAPLFAILYLLLSLGQE